jgi:putative Mn2+ efflux pump MntP
MTFEIILQIILLGLALSMDVFAVFVTDGLTYTDIKKRRFSLFLTISWLASSILKAEI